MGDKWIDSIRDKMTDHEVAPPAGLLEAVEAKVRAGRMRRRRIFGAIAASIALIGAVSVALIPDMPETSHESLTSDRTQEKTVKEVSEGIMEGLLNQIAGTAVDPGTVSVGSRSQRTAHAENMEVSDTVSGLLPAAEDKAEETSVDEPETRTAVHTYISSTKSDDSPYGGYAFTMQPIASRSDGRGPVSVGVSASANGLGGIFGEDGIENRPLMASAVMPHTRMGGGMLGSPNAVDPPAPRFIEVFDHKLPVRASVDFSWPLGYNLSIGTGLTYSYLRSDISYGYSDSPLFKASQSLHFLGIPVNVRYTPWSFRKLDIYVSAGFLAEKCLGGRIKTENPQDPGYSYVGCDDRPFRFSVNAAAGLQYSLAERCAVFIEPGLGLYMKNGSRLRTIYSERPVTFNVNVGLRFGK